jgi:branched-chain amino acid transport system substrate-binding protein
MKLKNLLLFGLIFLFIASCGKKEEEIKIGVIQPLTGELANFGRTVVNGIQLAVDDYKDSLNKEIKLVIEDSKGDPSTSVSAFNKLMNVDKVSIVIGDLTSSATLAIAPLAMKNKVLLISPTASNPALSNSGEYFFRVWPSDNYSGYVAANYSYNFLGKRNAAIIYINNDYGIGLKDVFKKTFEDLGGKVSIVDAYNQNQSDFRSVLLKIRNNKADLVYIPGHPYGIANVLKQARELNIKVDFFSDVAAEEKEFLNLAGETARGLYFVTPSFDINSQDDNIRKFVLEFEKRFHEKPDIHSVKGYEAALVLLIGFSSKIYNPDELVTFLKSERFESLSGKINFDENGYIITTMSVKQYDLNLNIKIIKHSNID